MTELLCQSALSEHDLAQMSFFFKHLEQKWSIKKRNNVYILQNVDGSKCTYTPEYLEKALALGHKDAAEMNELKRMQLLIFLHNALEGGWKIKKQSASTSTSNSSAFGFGFGYVFVKKHNGQYKMYEDDEYLTHFMKNNLSLE